MPDSFVLPGDFQAWVAAREREPTALWIYKPANLACGVGIKLLTSSSSGDKKLSEKTTGVIQRYLDKPMLINGYKFDLRIYVVVTSYDPLKVYLNTEGLVRLATERYERPSSDNLDHRTMHLTNYSVNKHSENYVPNQWTDQISGGECGGETEMMGDETDRETEREDGDEEAAAAEHGDTDDGANHSKSRESMPASKMSLEQLRDYCAETGQDYDLMMVGIKDVIIKTLLAAEAPIVSAWHQGANYSTSGETTTQVGPNQTCFEIYGFDIMFDENLKAWLLEVNTFPSLSSSSPFDKRVKTVLIADALTLVGFMPFDHELVDQAVKEDQSKKKLQGRSHSSLVAKSHTINSIASAPLKALGEAEWQLILDAHDEFLRRGHLERIYPTRETVESYASFFITPRYSNLVLARWLKAGGDRCFTPAERDRIPAWVPHLLTAECC